MMWHASILNLAVYTKGPARSRAQSDALGITLARVDRFNGRAMFEDELSGVHDAEGKARLTRHPLVLGEIRGHRSHINVWRAIAEGDAPGAFIFKENFACTGTG